MSTAVEYATGSGTATDGEPITPEQLTAHLTVLPREPPPVPLRFL